MRRMATFFVRFAVGALLGDAFIHLIPETFSVPSPPVASFTSPPPILSRELQHDRSFRSLITQTGLILIAILTWAFSPLLNSFCPTETGISFAPPLAERSPPPWAPAF